ncbi:cupin domain-containing protein [Variovorax sp. RHLX14]|uniref:cupin domain-containing protein n=1 Tax=Variovorax sp. RHLX14 TaxID=1259731 RepID=UPI003F47917F
MKNYPVSVSPADADTIMSVWVTGKVLADPQANGVGNLSAVSIYFDPGQGHARHNHSESEQLIFMIAGEAEMTIEFEEGRPQKKTIRGGDMVSIPKGAYHSTFNLGWEPVRILAVYSPPGPESAMRNSPDFTVLPAGEVPVRRGIAAP